MGFSFDKICNNNLPKGSYKALVEDIKFKTSASGEATNDMQVIYRISDGPFKGKTVSETISEKAFSFKLKPFLKAVGVDTAREFATAKELYAYGIKESKGKALMIDVSIRTYNGNEYNQVDGYAALPGSTTSAADVVAELGLDEVSVNTQPVRPTIDAVMPSDSVVEEPIIDIEKIF
jgi:kynurenine formamidase